MTKSVCSINLGISRTNSISVEYWICFPKSYKVFNYRIKCRIKTFNARILIGRLKFIILKLHRYCYIIRFYPIASWETAIGFIADNKSVVTFLALLKEFVFYAMISISSLIIWHIQFLREFSPVEPKSSAKIQGSD